MVYCHMYVDNVGQVGNCFKVIEPLHAYWLTTTGLFYEWHDYYHMAFMKYHIVIRLQQIFYVYNRYFYFFWSCNVAILL